MQLESQSTGKQQLAIWIHLGILPHKTTRNEEIANQERDPSQIKIWVSHIGTCGQDTV